jgi:hypothetical protein
MKGMKSEVLLYIDHYGPLHAKSPSDTENYKCFKH